MNRRTTALSTCLLALLVTFGAAGDALGVTHDVDVGLGFVFSPANLAIQLGDTVRWTWQPDGLFHNVESGVGGIHDGNFRSGNAVAVAGTTFSVTFDQAFLGANPMPGNAYPYYCIVHVAINMVGTITVNVPPPGVPDGTTGIPLTVTPLNLTGSVLSVSWDTATCAGAVDHKIIFGGGSQLPTTLGGVYGLAGSECNIGTTSPFTWTGVPDPIVDPTRMLWFVVVADDGASTEGSWGKDSAGSERTGPSPGGVSGLCGATLKDLGNACGQ